MRRAVLVFVGGGSGACLRALLLAWLTPWGATLPVPVLIANVLGAFILGIVFVLADEAGLLHAETRLFLAVGVLGGFTTFSTLEWGTDLLLMRGAGDAGAAIVYLVASLLGGVVAVSTGLVAGRELIVAVDGAAERLLGRTRHRPHRAGAARPDSGAIEAENREESA